MTKHMALSRFLAPRDKRAELFRLLELLCGSAILNFLEESHKKVEAVVPKIHEHYARERDPA